MMTLWNRIKSKPIAWVGLTALAVFFLTVLAGRAFAEGLPRTANPAAAAAEPAPWTGLYVGGGAGYQWYGLDCEHEYCEHRNFSDNGGFWLGDLKIGYDARVGTNLIAGIFATWSPDALIGKSGVDNIYTVGGRLGVVASDTLWYGGGAWTRAEGFGTSADGWAVLGGFERPLNLGGLNLTWGAEYKYSKFDDISEGHYNCELDGHTIMARLNWKLQK